MRLDEGWQRVGHDVAVMGNLDPVVLFANQDMLRRKGHIFNLGHGILPEPMSNTSRIIR